MAEVTHPFIRRSRRYFASGALVAGVGICTGAWIGSTLGVAVAMLGSFLGGYFVWTARSLHRAGVALPVYQRSLSLIANGRLDEAERLTDALPPRALRNAIVQHVLLNQRAFIAASRADFARAKELATECVELASARGNAWAASIRIDARGTRALACAALGEAIDEDLRAIDASPHALSTVLARARLARAVVLARSGERVALAEHLAAHGSLILENVTPRERSLTRALRGFARPERSVYREPARASADEASNTRAWIEAIVPDAGKYAPAEATAAETPARVETPSDPKVTHAVIAARFAAVPQPRVKRALALWAVLVVMFLALWQLLTPVPGEPPPDAPTAIGAWPIVLVLAFTVAFLVRLVRVNGAKQDVLLEAERAIALGRFVIGRRLLNGVATGQAPAFGAGARLQLASLANKEGDFAAAINETDAGFVLCRRSAAVLDATMDFVLPGLLAERALALAALDRFEEAESELSTLAHGFSGYALLQRAIFRVRLVSAVRKKDLATAKTIASMRTPDMPLDLRLDLLAALACGDRVDAELEELPAVAAWLEKVAPDHFGA